MFVIPHVRRGLLVPRLSRRGGAILSLLVAATCFGSSTIASKAVIDDVSPLTLAFARFALAVMVLLAVCCQRGQRPVFGRGPALLGLTGISLPFILQNIALQYSTAIETTLVIEGGLPIATAVLGIALLHERLTRQQTFCLALAVGGVSLVLLQGALAGSAFSGIGCLFALGASISFACYTVIGRRLFRDGFSLPVLTGAIASGVVFMIPGVLMELIVSGPGTISPQSGLIVLYLGLGGSAGTQLLWARGMADLTASEVSAIGTLMPVAGLISAAMFLGESMSVVQIAGGAVVLASIVATTLRADRPAASEQREERVTVVLETPPLGIREAVAH